MCCFFAKGIDIAYKKEYNYNKEISQGGIAMSMFENFKPFNFEEGVPTVSITKNGVNFNKAVVMKLDYPEYVQLLINDETKQVAVKVCSESSENSVPFYKSRSAQRAIFVRWNVRDLLNTFVEITGWDLTKEAYKVCGSLIKEENAILFDLNEAKLLS